LPPQPQRLSECFPSGFEPRKTQAEIMSRIDDALSSGHRHIILCAPTGVGKSHVAMAFARAMGTSHTLTAQKILQDQYTDDFAWALPLKGKSNFPCVVLCDKSAVDPAAGWDASVSCSRASCSWTESDHGRKKTVTCEHKPMPSQYAVSGRGTEAESVAPLAQGTVCHYYDQKYRALNASHTVFNYAAYFLTRKYPPSGAAEMLRRRCIVADEAHEIEDQLIDMVGMDIYRSHLSDVNLSMSSYSTDDIDGIKRMVEAAADAYHREVRDLEDAHGGSMTPAAAERVARFRRRRDDLDAVFHEEVSRILASHAGEKGLVLTSRKDQCDALAAHVRSEAGPEAAARLKIVHNDTGEERERTLAAHAKDGGPSVLVSPSLWYGVDLKGDLSRFQVIIKAPYLSLGDRRTRAKMERSDAWYKYASLTKLLQGMGRSVRDADDHAVTYVLDAGARSLIGAMRRYVPSSYRDVLADALR